MSNLTDKEKANLRAAVLYAVRDEESRREDSIGVIAIDIALDLVREVIELIEKDQIDNYGYDLHVRHADQIRSLYYCHIPTAHRQQMEAPEKIEGEPSIEFMLKVINSAPNWVINEIKLPRDTTPIELSI